MDPSIFNVHAQLEPKHWWFRARSRIIRTLLNELMPPSRDVSIIDIGCGTGTIIATLAEDYRVIGIDPSRHAIELARKNYPDTRFICGEVPESLSPEERKAQAYLLLDVLEHIEDDYSFFDKVYTSVSPGSLFLLTVPADMSLWSCQDESYKHFRRYSEERFSSLWRGKKVSELLLTHFNTRLYPIIKIIRKINRMRKSTNGHAGTDFHLPNPAINAILERIFSGEHRRLVRMLKSESNKRYPRGVSLLAIIRKL
jgi:SAM-dependent methyltransferase